MNDSSAQQTIAFWLKREMAKTHRSDLNDLHIDEIDSRWKRRETWIDGGIRALRMALRLREKQNAKGRVALAFSLVSSDAVRGVDFASREELDERLDWSPPSLYFFPGEVEPWAMGENGDSPAKRLKVEKLRSAILPSVAPNQECIYMEFISSGSSEYSRTVFLLA